MLKNHTDQKQEFERLAPALRRYARALVALDAVDPAAEADELARETLSRAMRAERAGRAGNTRIWLYSTLTTLNRARARARGASATPHPAKAGILGIGVTEALSAVPLDQRELLLLVVLEGFSYVEAADALGLPRPTVAARIARARQTLDERLAARIAESRGKPDARAPHLRLIK